MTAQGVGGYRIAVAVLAALLVGVVVWKMVADREARLSLEAQRAQYVQLREAQRQELLTQSQQALFALSTEVLRLSAVSLSWAVRGEMTNGNVAQVNSYFAQLAKNPGVQELLLTDPSGIVVVATNKAAEGQPLDRGRFSPTVLDLHQASITSQPTGEFSIAVPVEGAGAKLGTLILVYNRARVARVGCYDIPPVEQTSLPVAPNQAPAGAAAPSSGSRMDETTFASLSLDGNG